MTDPIRQTEKAKSTDSESQKAKGATKCVGQANEAEDISRIQRGALERARTGNRRLERRII